MMVRGASTVQVAPLSRRFVAAMIDALPVIVLAVLAVALPVGSAATRALLVGVAFGVTLAWLVYLWGRYALTGAGPGYAAMDLSLRDVSDGEAIGWGRYLLRQAVLVGLWVTVVGGVVLVITIVMSPRGRGWHDQVAHSIAVYRPRDRGEPAVPSLTWQPTDEAEAQRWAPKTESPTSPPASQPQVARSAVEPATTSRDADDHGVGAEQDHDGVPPTGDQMPASDDPPDSGHSDPGETGWGEVAVIVSAAEPDHPGDVQPAADPEPAGDDRADVLTADSPASPTVVPPPPKAPPVPVPPPKGAVLTPPPDAYVPPPSVDGDPLSAETPILPESAREEALEAARQRGWLPGPGEDPEHGVPDSAESTRVSVEPLSDFGWFLVLDDGRQVDVSRPLVIGRNPIPPPDRPNALAVRVGESGQAVSKTHLSVNVDGSGLFVVDLGSTNGTAVVGTTGALEPCKAHREVRVRDGQVVSFGDHAFTVRRRPRR